MKPRGLDLLLERCRLLGLALPVGAPDALIALLTRLAEEPQNLTAIRDLDAGVDRHLADSLCGLLLPEITGAACIADVGSGAGFPGLALAAACPEIAVSLIESEGRKADWLRRAAEPFPNVRVVRTRAETLALHEPSAFDAVVARALAPLPVSLELCAPLVSDQGAIVLWRGRRDGAEEAVGDEVAALLGFGPASITRVTPFPDVERHLALYRRTGPTPDRFPRRPGRAAHRPLP